MLKKKDDSEQRIISAVLLSLIVYLIWMGIFGPPPPAPEAEGGVVAEEVVEGGDESAAAAGVPAMTPENSGVVTPRETVAEPWQSPFESSTISASIGNDGGSLGNVELNDFSGAIEVTPIWSYVIGKVKGDEGDWKPYGDDPGVQRLISERGQILAAGSSFDFEVEQFERLPGEAGATAVRHLGVDGLQVTKSYRTTDDPKVIEIEVEFMNQSGAAWSGPLWVGAMDEISGTFNRYSNVARPELVVNGELERLEELEDLEGGSERLEGEVSWFGIGDRYFLAAALVDDPSWGGAMLGQSSDGLGGVFLVKEGVTLQPGERESITLRTYIGGKDLDSLRAFGKNLELTVDFGIFGFFSHILLKILLFFQSIVGNWGVAIICLTLFIKVLFFPLTKKSFVSSRKMQALAPKMKEIKEKHKDNPQAAGQAQMALFRDEGVNPLAGCFPMLIQMPVWFAFYSVLLGASDLYQGSFLYIQDLTSKDPYAVLPTLVGVFMFIQQSITPMSPNADPIQQKMFRMMPFIFVVVMYSFPSGLALYILVNTVFSIAQMWAVNRAYPMPAAAEGAK